MNRYEALNVYNKIVFIILILLSALGTILFFIGFDPLVGLLTFTAIFTAWALHITFDKMTFVIHDSYFKRPKLNT